MAFGAGEARTVAVSQMTGGLANRRDVVPSVTAGTAGRNRTGDNTDKTVLTPCKLLYLLSFQRHISHVRGGRLETNLPPPWWKEKKGRNLWPHISLSHRSLRKLFKFAQAVNKLFGQADNQHSR